jgi:diaminopimelate decarboxylase
VKVYVSGVHGGENPSPGVGCGNSLRSAFPELTLVAVDYSYESTGLHMRCFDQHEVLPSWDQIGLGAWGATVAALLDTEDARWLPGLDLEIALAADLELGRRYLAPGCEALARIDKRNDWSAKQLGLTQAEVLELPATGHEIARFLRRGPAWVKGRNYDAEFVRSPAEAFASITRIGDTWGRSGAFLERHVGGKECSIAFAALNGVLLDAVYIEKHLRSRLGKTWSAELRDLPNAMASRLRGFVEDADWSGGGEVEMIRTAGGEWALMEVNPRFPGWINGGSVAGRNLPASLIAASFNIAPRATAGSATGFVRVVTEIPVSPSVGLLPAGIIEARAESAGGASKHPSGMPLLARKRIELASSVGRSTRLQQAPVDYRLLGATLNAWSGSVATPCLIELPQLVKEAIDRLRNGIVWPNGVDIAYSAKTNPGRRLMTAARESGLLLEAISQDEVSAALEVGFSPEDVILNGPAKWWPELATEQPVRLAFVDSSTELEKASNSTLLRARAHTFGLRIGSCRRDSRFGIGLESYDAIRTVAALLGPIIDEQGSIGIHVHYSATDRGWDSWLVAMRSAISYAQAVASAANTDIALVDLGGGWHARDVEPYLRVFLPAVLADLRQVAPEATLVLEPGRMLTSSGALLLTSVLEVRRYPDGIDVVVDGSIADLPTAGSAQHPVGVLCGDSAKLLPAGGDRLLGRTCMEADVLSNTLDLSSLEEGDGILFLDAGAYDASTAYSFGRGSRR